VMIMLIVLMVVMRISVIQEMIQIELRSVIHLSAGCQNVSVQSLVKKFRVIFHQRRFLR